MDTEKHFEIQNAISGDQPSGDNAHFSEPWLFTSAGFLYRASKLGAIKRWFAKILLLFKGLPMKSKQDHEKQKENKEPVSIVTVIYPVDAADCPASDTHPYDKQKAELALSRLDPTKTVRQ